ncbi:MAG: hypothetical protein B7Z08_04830 [Sphingomonadales bacterium 32-68-7]|nr:MAG: hypothetical protein B7Z08_04830 [Sphingomonadales bacterium 32-68-7]
MPAPQAKLGADWQSPTDIRTTITRIQSTRAAQSNLLRNLAHKLDTHRDQVSTSLRTLDAKDRPSIVTKSVNGLRGQLVRESKDQRVAHTRELVGLADRLKKAASHYRSPVQMLMRETLGSERRSRVMQQISGSGRVELASLAEYAAATADKDLAAALCSRVGELPRADRPFSATELADVMFGDLHRELSQAMIEAERRVLEALSDDTEFETGKSNSQRTLQIALLKKREQEIGAYGFDEADADDETAVE